MLVFVVVVECEDVGAGGEDDEGFEAAGGDGPGLGWECGCVGG